MCGAQFRNVARNLVLLKHKDLNESLAGKHSIMKHNAFILVVSTVLLKDVQPRPACPAKTPVVRPRGDIWELRGIVGKTFPRRKIAEEIPIVFVFTLKIRPLFNKFLDQEYIGVSHLLFDVESNAVKVLDDERVPII
eukprot:sb/3474560/